MRIGIIGGVERTEAAQVQLAARYGHELVFHGGHMNGRGSPALENLIHRCDVVVIVTDVNSHNAVHAARRALKQRGMSPIIVRRLGMTRLEELLSSLGPAVTTAA